MPERFAEDKKSIVLSSNEDRKKALKKALEKALEAIRHAKEQALRAYDFEVADVLKERQRELIDLVDKFREQPEPTVEPWEKPETIKSTFEQFTEKAHMAFWLAEQESRKMGHQSMSTELILLGLMSQGTGIAAKTLKSMGVHLNYVRVKVENIIGRGPSFVAEKVLLSEKAKKLLWRARIEAKQLGHNYIGTEHLLLAIADEEEGDNRFLEFLGVDPAKLRAKVLELLKEGGAATA
jgi:hypothetical protein